MLELRTFYCPLVFIINEKGPDWSFLKFRESIKTRSWNAILLVLEMCEIILSCGKKKKVRGVERKTQCVRDTVKMCIDHINITMLWRMSQLCLESTFHLLSVCSGGRAPSGSAHTDFEFPTCKGGKKNSEKAKKHSWPSEPVGNETLPEWAQEPGGTEPFCLRNPGKDTNVFSSWKSVSFVAATVNCTSWANTILKIPTHLRISFLDIN